MGKTKAQRASQPLLFVDSNVLLDFYRARNDAQLTLLGQLEKVKNQLIITSQVEMEFKRNRQAVLLDTFNQFKQQKLPPVPVFLRESKTVKSNETLHSKLSYNYKKMSAKLAKMLEDPVKHDRVFQTCQRLFSASSPYNLHREHDMRRQIRRRAFRRWINGYPPRKSNDNSIGDAFNWEWCIYCCGEASPKQRRSLLIVSRDSDFGILHSDRSYINDHLLREFRDRVSLQKDVSLTVSLSDALKAQHILVDKSAADAERSLTSSSPPSTAPEAPLPYSPDFWRDLLRRVRVERVQGPLDDLASAMRSVP